MTFDKDILKKSTKLPRWGWRLFLRYWNTGWWQKTITVGVVVVTLILSTMYGIALWYQHEQNGKPASPGITFIADYAGSYGLDPHQTLTAILDQLQVKHLRLVSYCADDIEPTQGHYNFSELDWEMGQAKATWRHSESQISALRQPRWPECHAPSWIATTAPESAWEPTLQTPTSQQ